MQKIKVLVQRTAMIGGGLSYRLYVPLKNCSKLFQKYCHSTISLSEFPIDAYFVNFNEAILPDSHVIIEPGWDKYDAWNAHEKAAKAIEFKVASEAFPELKKLGGMPSLWATGLMDKETSADAWVFYTYDETQYAINNA
jgi:hypothetical protein